MTEILIKPTHWVNLPTIFFHNDGADEYVIGGEMDGGFAYVKDNNGFGHDLYNFTRADDGLYYGYTPIAGANLKRLTGIIGLSETNCNVVFFGRGAVVGMYLNATLQRKLQRNKRFYNAIATHEEICYLASSKHAVIIPLANRNIIVPHCTVADGGFGQSGLWYGDGNGAKLSQGVAICRRQIKALIASEIEKIFVEAEITIDS